MKTAVMDLVERIDSSIETIGLIQPLIKLHNAKRGKKTMSTMSIDLQEALQKAVGASTHPIPLDMLVNFMDVVVASTITNISTMCFKDNGEAWENLIKDACRARMPHATTPTLMMMMQSVTVSCLPPRALPLACCCPRWLLHLLHRCHGV